MFLEKVEAPSKCIKYIVKRKRSSATKLPFAPFSPKAGNDSAKSFR